MQRVGVMVAALLALALGGCGSDDEQGAPAAPEGWRVNESKWFAFSHPPDWTARTRPAQTGNPGETVTELTAPRSGSEPLAVVVVGATPKYGSGFRGLLEANESNALVRFSGARVVDERDLDLPGAKDAKLIERELAPGSGAGAPTVPLRIFDVVALSEDDTAVNMAAQVKAADVDRSRVKQVLDSLRLR